MSNGTAKPGSNAVVFLIVAVAFVGLTVWNAAMGDPWFAIAMGGLAVVWAALGIREIRRGRKG